MRDQGGANAYFLSPLRIIKIKRERRIVPIANESFTNRDVG